MGEQFAERGIWDSLLLLSQLVVGPSWLKLLLLLLLVHSTLVGLRALQRGGLGYKKTGSEKDNHIFTR